MYCLCVPKELKLSLKFNLFNTYESHLVRTDKYFVSFSACNPTLDQACSHWLTHSLFLLFLAQHYKLVTTLHEHSAMIIDAG